MAKALDQPPGRMTVDQFVAWAMAQPEGRFELVSGTVVAIAPERAAHARLKSEVWLALRTSIKSAGLPCEALPDGMTVKIDEHTAYEPDAQVHCGERLADDTVIVPAPVIVVEVLRRAPRRGTPAPSSPIILGWRVCITI
jgi:Uma2 family endonuclease